MGPTCILNPRVPAPHLEALHGGREVGVDGLDAVGENPALGPPDLHALKLVELRAGDHHIHHVVAALQVAIEALEQAAVLELPRVLLGLGEALGAVLEVELLEVGQHPDGEAELVDCLRGLHLDQLRAWDELVGLRDTRARD